MGPKKMKDSYLKNNGIDAEEVKDVYGCDPVSHYDLYNGDTITIRDKKGNLYEDTEMSKDEFFKEYGKLKENVNE